MHNPYNKQEIMDAQGTNVLDSTDEVKSRMTHGFGVLIAREFAIKILAAGGQLLLARLLSPEDFGLYAIIIFIITFFGLFSDVGLSPAIIQKKNTPSQRELSSIFLIKMGLSIVLVGIIFVSAPFFQIIYPSFQGEQIMMLRLLSITLLFTVFRSIPFALLERELKYNNIATIDIVGVVTYYIITIFCAFSGFGVWSFVIGVLLKEFVEVFVAYFYKPWFPQFVFRFAELKDMLRFGSFIQASGIANFIYNSMIPVVGGIKGGPYAVGLLDWGSNIVSVPESITNNFSRVAFSGFARLQHDKELLSTAIAKSVSILTLITFFFTVLILGFANEGVPLVFTDKWVAGIPALYWFAAAIPLYGVITAYSQGLLALGKSRIVFLVSIISFTAGLFTAFILVQIYGFIGVAIASSLSYVFLFSFYHYFVKKSSVKIELIHLLFPKVLIGVITLLFIFTLNIVFQQGFVLFILKVLIAISFYGILTFVFAKKELMTMINLFNVSFDIPNITNRTKKK